MIHRPLTEDFIERDENVLAPRLCVHQWSRRPMDLDF
jgi:hypothetical protein